MTPVMAGLLAFAPREWTIVEPIVLAFLLLGIGINVRSHIANQREWLNFERAVLEAMRVEGTEAEVMRY